MINRLTTTKSPVQEKTTVNVEQVQKVSVEEVKSQRTVVNQVKQQAEKMQPVIINRSNLDLPCFLIGQLQEKKIEEVIKRFCVVPDVKAAPPQKPVESSKVKEVPKVV